MKLGGIGAIGGSALVAVSLLLTPALAASKQEGKRLRPSLSLRGSGFTPAVTDPRLAAELARRGYQPNSFRFTPASAAVNRSQSIRVAIRARAATPAVTRRAADASASTITAVTPSVYNMGASVGWKRFAISGDVDRVRGGAIATTQRDAAQVDVSYDAAKRFTGRVEMAAARADGAKIIGEERSYTVGVGGSFRLSRNLDVTGGVRYRIQRDRLEALEDQRRDAQAVYVGTAFRF
ncbi:MAG TPA: porin [Allosphingosinicella sp.]|jgi:hypothetical protein